jgi:glycosyltransferase involved in cell wall biosynthesis
MTGEVSDSELSSYYRNADVFVCLSEHEGFCVPLLEAFANKLPIIAYRSSAVPETLGDAGLLLDDKSPAVVATAVETLRNDASLRSQLVAAGQKRLDSFDLEDSKTAFLNAVEKVLP